MAIAPSYLNSGGKGARTGVITVTSNASFGGTSGTPPRLVDGNFANNSSSGVWVNNSQAAAMNFVFDFGAGASKVITEAKWYQNGSSAQPGAWKWQTSPDNVTYTDASATFTLDGGSAGSVIGNLSANTTGARYYRLLQTTNAGGNDTPWLWECEFKIDDSTSSALALDGTPANATATASSVAVSLTTALANDMICVAITCNGGPVTSVTASGLTFTRRARNANGVFNIELWYATAAAALTAKSITVNQTSSAFISVTAFAVNDPDGGTVMWDGNGALPSLIGDGSGTVISTRTAITTTNAKAFLIGAYRVNVSSPTAGAGWSQIAGTNFMLVEGGAVSSVQTARDVTIGTGNNGQNGGIGDALTVLGPLSLDGAQTIPAWAQAVTATVIDMAAAAQSIPAWGQAATVARLASAIAGQTIPDWAQSFTAVRPNPAVAAQVIPDWAQSFNGTMIISASASQIINPWTVSTVQPNFIHGLTDTVPLRYKVGTVRVGPRPRRVT